MTNGQSRVDVLLMAGGTGGHIFPALAVADCLQARGHSVAWLGSLNSMEAVRVPAAGIAFHGLTIQGFRGKGRLSWLMAPFRLLRSVWQAWHILRRIRPRAVIGFGGFASGPGGLAAWLLRIPLYVHEQNALPGLTNRCLARLSRQVFTAFPGVLPKAVVLGNPVRESLLQLPSAASRYAARTGPLHLLVIGGSLGAQVLNTTLPKALALLPAAQQPRVWHQCGQGKQALTLDAYQASGLELGQIRLMPFIEDMAEAFAWADVVLCRAGALTVSELTAAGVAAILVPFPFAVDDHQTHNALFLSQADAAVLVRQSELTSSSLARLLGSLQRNELQAMAERAHQLAQPRAAEQLATIISKDIQ